MSHGHVFLIQNKQPPYVVSEFACSLFAKSTDDKK